MTSSSSICTKFDTPAVNCSSHLTGDYCLFRASELDPKITLETPVILTPQAFSSGFLLPATLCPNPSI